MERIRFGLYGYGKVAELHAKAMASCDSLELVAVCGRDKTKAANFAAKWGIADRSSPAQMAEKDGVRAIIITTPHPLHAAHAMEALRSGVAALVEKPMALTVAECDAMLAASESSGALLGAISQRRLYPSVQRVKKAIDEGHLGVPMLGQVTMLGWRDSDYYRSDPWRGSWEFEGGGVIVNQAPHQLDLLSYFMGPVVSVAGDWINANHPYIDVDDSAAAVVRFASGGMASIFVSNSQKPGIYAKVHIHGSSGASAGIQTDGGAMFIAGMSGVLEPPYNDLWTIPGQEGMLDAWRAEDAAFFNRIEPTWYFFARQIEDFACAVRDGGKPLVSGRESRETVKIMEGIYRSAKSGQTVRYEQ